MPPTDPSSDTSQDRKRRHHLALNTLLVAGSFGLAAAAGLAWNIIIARQFGIGAELDTYFAAFKLPDLLFTIVAGGALATAFIPVFADFLAVHDREGAWRLASAITNLVVLITIGLAAAAALAAPWLVDVAIAPGFDELQRSETASLMRLVLLSTVLFGISSVQSSVLHGFKHFLLPALAPAVYPLGIALGAVFLAPGMGIQGLADIGHLLTLVIGGSVGLLVYIGAGWLLHIRALRFLPSALVRK